MNLNRITAARKRGDTYVRISPATLFLHLAIPPSVFLAHTMLSFPAPKRRKTD